jgi:hypothetical protein
MRTIRTHITSNAFAATMSAMRFWLDQHGNPDIRFEIAQDDTGIVISLEFSADDVACAFAHRFANALLPARVRLAQEEPA